MASMLYIMVVYAATAVEPFFAEHIKIPKYPILSAGLKLMSKQHPSQLAVGKLPRKVKDKLKRIQMYNVEPMLRRNVNVNIIVLNVVSK